MTQILRPPSMNTASSMFRWAHPYDSVLILSMSKSSSQSNAFEYSPYNAVSRHKVESQTYSSDRN